MPKYTHGNALSRCWCLDSTVDSSGQCPVSACWDKFQSDILQAHLDDIHWTSDSTICFQSVQSDHEETDIYLETQNQIPVLYDEDSLIDDHLVYIFPE